MSIRIRLIFPLLPPSTVSHRIPLVSICTSIIMGVFSTIFTIVGAISTLTSAISYPSTNSSVESLTGSACACDALAQAHPDLLLTSNSSMYLTRDLEVWDRRCNQYPTCIYVPATPDDVADGIGIFNKCSSHFAVRGGGHMNVGYMSLVPRCIANMGRSILVLTISTTEF